MLHKTPVDADAEWGEHTCDLRPTKRRTMVRGTKDAPAARNGGGLLAGRDPTPSRSDANPEGGGRRAALALLDRAPSLSLSARVFQQLRDAVVSGELAPSAPVIIEQLAPTLGVSRTPIRES